MVLKYITILRNLKRHITFDNVIKWFSDYCEPRKNVIFQRYKFGNCVQKEGQTFNEFVTELKTLSSLCEYKEEDNMVRDRIVFGIRDAKTKNKLLSMNNLTLDRNVMQNQRSNGQGNTKNDNGFGKYSLYGQRTDNMVKK